MAVPAILASLIMSSGLWGMAGLGLASTSKISSDNQERFKLGWAELDQQNRYLDIREAELKQERGWQIYDAFGYGGGRADSSYQADYLERINLEASLQAQRDELYYARQIALQQNDQAHAMALNAQIMANEQALQASGFSNQQQLASQYFQQDLQRDALNAERNLIQTSLIQAGDQMMQDQRLMVQNQLQNVELQQEVEEYNRYKAEQAYKEQHSFAQQFGNETNVNKLSYIIMKLKELLPQYAMQTHQLLTADPDLNPPGDYNEFDYTRWDEIPEERMLIP